MSVRICELEDIERNFFLQRATKLDEPTEFIGLTKRLYIIYIYKKKGTSALIDAGHGLPDSNSIFDLVF